MKTLKEFLEEATKVAVNKVMFREKDRPTTGMSTVYKGNPIGWFANKHNMAEGWVIYPMDNQDLAWFKEQKEPTKMVYRIANGRNTTLVRINLKSNRMQWHDDAKYAETDKITWQKKWYTWDRLIIDNTTRAFKHFDVNGEYK
jgi:hypothetical protein